MLFAHIVTQSSALVGLTHNAVDTRRLDEHPFLGHAVRFVELVRVVLVVDVSSD